MSLNALLAGAQGGTVETNAEVDEILTSGDRAQGIRLTTGAVVAADVVVSNADPGQTYDRLLRRQS